MTGVFEGFPAAFQEVAVLGIHEGGVAGADVEEGRIERFDVFQHAGDRDVVLVRRHLGADTRGDKLLRSSAGYARGTRSDQLPIGIEVSCAGEAPGHTDDRDVAGSWTSLQLREFCHGPVPRP